MPQLIRHVAERQARKGRPHGQALRQVASLNRAGCVARKDGPPRSLGVLMARTDAANAQDGLSANNGKWDVAFFVADVKRNVGAPKNAPSR